jgi:hypothetical protein
MPEKKPFYSAKPGKPYDYKKNNAGIGKLASDPKDMLAARNKNKVDVSKAPLATGPLYSAKKKVDVVGEYNKNLANGLKVGTKPKPKSKDEIKAAVKSATPKAGKYVAPYGKVAQKRGEATARKQDPQGLVHKNNRNPGINVSRKTYTAVKGDSLYGIAEKTLPKGKDLGSWFSAIKKMNAGKKLFAGTGVAIPSKSRPVSGGHGR